MPAVSQVFDNALPMPGLQAHVALSHFVVTLLSEGAPHHCVLADPGYGVDTAFRRALSDMGLMYYLNHIWTNLIR